MAHLIPDDAIERLSHLRGVSLNEFQSQIEGNERIRAQIHSSVDAAWQACFPTWLEFGRVNDFSYRLRLPRYFPSYANQLGREFVEVHQSDYIFLIDILSRMPPHSYEYLCAYDLLEMIAYEFYSMDDSIPDQIQVIDLPVPSVVWAEKGWDERFHGLETIGGVIYQSCLISYGDA